MLLALDQEFSFLNLGRVHCLCPFLKPLQFDHWIKKSEHVKFVLQRGWEIHYCLHRHILEGWSPKNQHSNWRLKKKLCWHKYQRSRERVYLTPCWTSHWTWAWYPFSVLSFFNTPEHASLTAWPCSIFFGWSEWLWSEHATHAQPEDWWITFCSFILFSCTLNLSLLQFQIFLLEFNLSPVVCHWQLLKAYWEWYHLSIAILHDERNFVRVHHMHLSKFPPDQSRPCVLCNSCS